MKKQITLGFLLFFTSLTSFSQWYWVNPKPHGEHIYGSFFTSSTTGYLAGEAGRILKTTNGGTSWTMLHSGTGDRLGSVYFTDPSTGYIASSNGVVLKTTDAGASWNPLHTGVSDDLLSVFFTDANTGYASGDNGTILKTINAGTTWTEQVSGSTQQIKGLYFKDASNGFALAAGNLLKTSNGGSTWTSQSICSCVLHGIGFADASNALLAGSAGKLYKSTNGGGTWSSSGVISPSTDNLFDIKFTDASNGFMAGNQGIYKTVNGGASWTSGSPSGLNGITLSIAGSAFVAAGYNGVIFTSSDGSTWNAGRTGYQYTLQDIEFTSSNIGYAVGYPGAILKTTDQGDTWTDLSIPGSYNLLHMDFVDDNTGYAAGQNGVIVKTINGGQNWTTLQSGKSYFINSVSFIDANTGFITTDEAGGRILKTTNGGITWTNVIDIFNVRKVYFLNATTGIAAGYNSIYQTTDGGVTWTSVSGGTGSDIFDIFFVDQNLGYISTSGSYFKTTNSGATWTLEQVYLDNPENGYLSGISEDLRFIGGTDATTLYTGGSSGKIYVSYDAGSSWHLMDRISSSNLNAIAIADQGKMLVAGNFGTILKSAGEEPCSIPEITLQPTDKTECAGNETGFIVFLKKYYRNTSFVWKIGSDAIPSSNQRSIGMPSVTTGDAGAYSVEITNGCGTTVSNTATLTVKPSPMVEAGSSITACENEAVTLTATTDATNFYWDGFVNDGVPFVPPSGVNVYTVTAIGSNGCAAYDQITVTVNNCTPVTDPLGYDQSVTIYPNPSSGKISIETVHMVQQITITDMKGQELMQERDTKEINLNGIPAGIYSVKIVTDKGWIIKKLDVR